MSLASTSASRFLPGEALGYFCARSTFGWMMVAASARGLCWLALAATKQEAIAALRAEFAHCTPREDKTLHAWIESAEAFVLRGVRGRTQKLDLRGTALQQEVWQEIQKIPRGETRSYSELAVALGRPRAVRAVAAACGANRVALLVPCHRVIGARGALTGYRWGLERKRQLLEAEGAHLEKTTRALMTTKKKTTRPDRS